MPGRPVQRVGGLILDRGTLELEERAVVAECLTGARCGSDRRLPCLAPSERSLDNLAATG